MKTHIKHYYNFFETGHQKGEHDGAGTCIKRALRRYQMDYSANILVSFEQVFQWWIVALSHETNPSRNICMYLHIYINLYIFLIYEKFY